VARGWRLPNACLERSRLAPHPAFHPASMESNKRSVPSNSVFAPAEKRLKPASASSGNRDCIVENISDTHKLSQRQKQIDFGKNTLSYERYRREVPRKERTFQDPRTPDISDPMSKRRFDGKVKQWRRGLHEWELAHPASAAADVPASETMPASGSQGLTGSASSFDALLDDYLDGDADVLPLPPAAATAHAKAEPGTSAASAAPVGFSAAALPPASARPLVAAARPAEVTPRAAPPSSAAPDASTVRQRLDQLKNRAPGPAHGATIFAVFDDNDLV
jgi:hypothetical protein